MFKIALDIIEMNSLDKFDNDGTIIVASRV